MKILIVTEPDDMHAALVKIALEHKGHHCLLWFTADMPTKQTNSIYFANNTHAWLSEDTYSANIMSIPFDIVWWRRPRRPVIEKASPEDMAFIRKENGAFFDSIPFMLAPNAWWINPLPAIQRANSKILQLNIASKYGLKIPNTLISNEPNKIKDFISKNKGDGVIYKAFSSHNWYEDNILRMCYTKQLDQSQLPPNDILQLTPGIFQQHLKKKYELRITCFGDNLIAVKIASQENPKGKIDWRIIPPNELKLEPYTLPPTLAQRIRLYMNELGIVFGCFDFIVTPENEFYFLEVNQQGQFLWVEDRLPELKMLDKFTQFITAKSVQFEWKNSNTNLSDHEEAASKLVDKNLERHIFCNALKKNAA